MDKELPLLMRIREAQDLYADALVLDDTDRLLFASIYGRDASLQQLRAALSLPISSGGIDRLSFDLIGAGKADPRAHTAFIGDASRLKNFTGRLPRDTLFGALAQLWLYDPVLTSRAVGARSAYLIHAADDAGDPVGLSMPSTAAVWTVIQSLSSIPLLDQWAEPVIDAIAPLAGPQPRCIGRQQVWHVQLPDTFEAQISALVAAGHLTERLGLTGAAQAA